MMKLTLFSVEREAVAEDSLLRTYRGGTRPERWGKYGDCFSLIAEQRVSRSGSASSMHLPSQRAFSWTPGARAIPRTILKVGKQNELRQKSV